MDSNISEDGYLIKEKNILGERFLEISDMMYHYNNATPVAANMSYIGSPEEEGTRFSTAMLRDFVENTEATKMKLNILFGGLFLKSREMSAQEQDVFIRSLQNTTNDDQAREILDNAMFGLGDIEKTMLFRALNKIKNTAENLGRSFEKSASEQNPFFSKILELRKTTVDEQRIFLSNVSRVFGYDQNINQNYKVEEFKSDLTMWSKDGVIPDRLLGMANAGMIEPPKEFWEYNHMSESDRENFLLKHVTPLADDPKRPNYEKLTTLHNNAAHTAREIVTKAFFGKTTDDFSVGDCIPLFDGVENIETYVKNMRGVLLNAAKNAKENDLQIAKAFGDDKSFELWIAEEVGKKIVENPSESFKRSIRQIDSSKIEPSEIRRTPNAKTEEILLKTVEDAIYNAIMKINGGHSVAAEMGVISVNDDVIDIENNLLVGKYDPTKYTNRERNDLKQARDLHLIQDTFKQVQNGKYSKEDAIKALSMMETNVLGDEEKKAVGEAIGTFYDRKTASFDPSNYNISRDDLQYTMDVNSSIIERQAREIYNQFYGDKKFDHILGAMGLARSKGQDFFGCISSGRNATIRTHSPGHTIKGCIDKLVQDYEKAAAESTRNLDNPLIAASGIAGFLVVFGIFQEASAQRLKQTALRFELDAAEKINFAAEAKTPHEKVARDCVIRNAQEKVTEEIVKAEEMDSYIAEALWANHEFQRTQNPYLSRNVSLSKIISSTGKEEIDGAKYSAKALAAHEAIMEVLNKSGMAEELKEYMDEARNQEQVAYEEKRLSLQKEITELSKSQNNEDIAKSIQLQERYVSLLKDGVSSGADPKTLDQNLELERLFDSQVRYGQKQLESTLLNIKLIQNEILSYESNQDRSAEEDELLLKHKKNLIGMESNLHHLERLLVNTEQHKNEIAKVRNIASNQAFANAYSLYESPEKLAQRYGGMHSAQLFLSKDLNRIDAAIAYLKDSKPGKYKTEELGNALVGIKTALRTLMLEQVSEKTGVGAKTAFMRYRNSHPSEALSGSDIKFNAIKQRDGSYQVLMMEKAVIPDLKTLKNEEGRSLVDSLELGTKTRNEFDVYLRQQLSLFGKNKSLDVDGIGKILGVGNFVKIDSVEQLEKFLNKAYDEAREDVAEFSRRCGISQVGETRYSSQSSRKDLSNVYSAGLARREQGGFFDGVLKSKESLISRGKR